MTKVLVVDDSKIDRVLVEELLADGEFGVECVGSGAEALARIEQEPPDVVVTDLMMPEMDGLELVAKLRDIHPGIPVILMTSRGSEEIAVRALRAGAASYVPKRLLEQELLPTVRDVSSLSRDRHAERELLSAMRRTTFEFCLASNIRLLRPLVRYLQAATARLGLSDETERTQMAMALHEALHNAIEHGNLELDSALREEDHEGYCALLEQRNRIEPYRDRKVAVAADLSRDEVRFTIRDEGHGFDPGTLPDPRDTANLEKLSGRGVFLMRTFMDEVTFNDVGNEVTLVLKLPR